MSLTTHPLTTERMEDLDAIFQAKGCSVAKNCYCIYYRVTNREYKSSKTGPIGTRNREWMSALTEKLTPGLIGYLDGRPVGWISFGPRPDFRRLETSPTMRQVDEQPVWSIICFVVPSEYRGQGVAHGLLKAAIKFAAKQGARLLEAYPVDTEAPGSTNAPWFGSLSMFEAAGFTEVARHSPARPIVRMQLHAPAAGA